ncbi:MAG: phage baseplate assembly protein V [Rhodocyclaceae bacterium]|nr:phage baseplate assembly protein V [Rhodocyclaceae bacterium]
MDVVELSRLVENLIRIGTIAEVDHAAGRCRVKSGELLTQWLPWFALRAGATTTWDPPTVGEQVMLLSPSGEPSGGVALTGIYSTAIAPPSHSADEHVTHYPDGATVAYNHATGALTATGIKTALVQAADAITLEAPDILIDAAATLHLHAGVRFVFDSNGHGEEWLADRVNTWRIGEIAGTAHPISPPEIP